MIGYQVIIAGGLNTDIIGLGVNRLLQPGELTLGGKLKVGPGGKARNMAQMVATYLGKGKVAMIGRTSQDPFGLWEIPIHSLSNAGVDTTYVHVLPFQEAEFKYPGIALIPVDKEGRNQIYVLPGANEDFSPDEVKKARALFQPNRILILALEIPLDTVRYSIDLASSHGMKVILDPGGLSGPIDDLLSDKIFMIKPNEHEAGQITGLTIHDFHSAGLAAQSLLSRGIRHVLITHGPMGAYLFNHETSLHIPCKKMPGASGSDETGCGDQVTAIVAACLAEGMDMQEAARQAILAGTMQFYREGVQPVSRDDLDKL